MTTSGWEFPDYFAGPGVTPTVEWGYARGEGFERTREEHLQARENFAIFDFELSDAQMQAISALARPDGRLVDMGGGPAWD